jgi:predicted nucleic acid-binding Zn ribbon protein
VWAAAAGAHIARHSTPHVLEGNTLVLTVATAEWAQALSVQEASLLEKLNERLGPGMVTALSFRLESR